MTRTLPALGLLALGLVALTACGDKDGEGRGDDTATDAPPPDTDGAGLTDDEEADLGLDPNSADTDMDGFDDLTEVEAGTDGTLCWSVPEGWPQCAAQAEADGRTSNGWAIGDIIEDWPAIDQNGEALSFYDFHGMVVVVDISAGWCGPCNTAAPGTQDFYVEFKDQGVMVIHLMIDDWSYDGVVSDGPGFSQDWATEHGLTFPVVTDDSTEGYATAYYNWYFEGYVNGVPSMMIIGRDGELLDTWSGDNKSRMRSVVEGAL